MRAIVAAIEEGRLDARARLVVSNRANAPALDFGRAHRVSTRHIPTLTNPTTADACMARALSDSGADWVILSGYLRKLGPQTLAAFDRRILNVHPALLPKHGGEGMYGRRVHEAVIADGDAVTGATIHLVDADYDHGQVVASVEIPVRPEDTAQSIESLVMSEEPKLFVATLQAIAAGTLRL